MKNGFQSNGAIEFFRAKEARLWRAIKAKYAAELASSSRLRKLRIKFQMQREFLRRRKQGHDPSAKSLW
jgi:hypothetical protein